MPLSKKETLFGEMEARIYGIIKKPRPLKISSNFPQYAWPKYVKRDPLLWTIEKRVHYHDENALIVCVGETGAGKSETMCTLADMVDITPLGNETYTKDFVVADDGKGNPVHKCRVVFRAADFLRLINSNLPRGSVIIWDEAGIGNDNTQWYDKKSRIVKYVMQAFRHKNYIVIMTVPDIESITLATRRLIHCIIDVQERNEAYSRCAVTWLQRARSFKKTRVYPKYPAYVDKETGTPVMVKDYYIPKLKPELQKPYQRIKNRFGDNLYSFAEEEMKEMERISMQFSGDKKEMGLRKFDLVRCFDLVDANKPALMVDGAFSIEKIMFFLAKEGYETKPGNVKAIIKNL